MGDMMKETPILFSDAMVRAILEGRKTQTRRIVKPQPIPSECPLRFPKPGKFYVLPDPLPTSNERKMVIAYCESPGTTRYMGQREFVADFSKYKVGDRLWVREGVIQIGHERTGRNGQYLWPKWDNHEAGKTWLDSCCHYTTDITDQAEWDRITAEPCGRLNKMFMPRWASRITLEITGVKVERLNAISAADAEAEGVEWNRSPLRVGHTNPVSAFKSLWESINGKGSWAANPWVWAISFTRVVAGQKGKS